jgi:hypothetical protein
MAVVESVRGARQLHELAELTEAAATTTSTSTSTKQVVPVFVHVKLTTANELSPIGGVPNAAGIAEVKLDFNPSRSSGKWKVCIDTYVIGFTLGLLHIHKDKISDNRGVSVDFTLLLSGDPVFDGCVAVTQSVFNDMKLNPVRQPGARLTIMALLHPYCL